MPAGLITLKDAAAELGVTPATLRQQIHNGRLKAEKVGRDWLMTRREFDRYQAASRGRPGRRPAKPAR